MISNRLLIVGAGDVARRALPALAARHEVHAMFRSASPMAEWKAAGAHVFTGDLDRPDFALAGLRDCLAPDLLLHSAPPPAGGEGDPRTRALLAALDARGARPRRLVYIGTSGVYGDCHGERVDESRPVNPDTPRARRRADAERELREWCTARGTALVILRAPGIYAADRLPLARLRAGTPVLARPDDPYTNHIHADDLAAICVRALESDAPPGTYNAGDDSEIRMGDWMDAVADRFGLPRPPRIALAGAEEKIPAPMLSFLNESRRLSNTKLKDQLGYRLQYPTVHEGLAAAQEDVAAFMRRAATAARGQGASSGVDKSTGASAPGLVK